jgi:hypothetical protein
VTAACSKVPVVTVARDLPRQHLDAVYEMAADIALHNNCMITIVGQSAHDELVLCVDGCCTDRPGVVVLVADVEAISLWGKAPKTASLVRTDGRVTYVFAGRGPRR